MSFWSWRRNCHETVQLAITDRIIRNKALLSPVIVTNLSLAKRDEVVRQFSKINRKMAVWADFRQERDSAHVTFSPLLSEDCLTLPRGCV